MQEQICWWTQNNATTSSHIFKCQAYEATWDVILEEGCILDKSKQKNLLNLGKERFWGLNLYIIFQGLCTGSVYSTTWCSLAHPFPQQQTAVWVYLYLWFLQVTKAQHSIHLYSLDVTTTRSHEWVSLQFSQCNWLLRHLRFQCS